MTELDAHIKRIHGKVQELLKTHQTLQKERNQLRQELETAQEQVAKQQKNIEELRQQLSVVQLAAGEMNETDKKEFEKRINGYLKEIDRCIALLSE